MFWGTPHMNENQMDRTDLAENANVINVYDKGDWVQKIGSGQLSGGRKMAGATNIPVYQTEIVQSSYKGTIYTSEQSVGPFDSHVNLDLAPMWDQYVKPELAKTKVTE